MFPITPKQINKSYNTSHSPSLTLCNLSTYSFLNVSFATTMTRTLNTNVATIGEWRCSEVDPNLAVSICANNSVLVASQCAQLGEGWSQVNSVLGEEIGLSGLVKSATDHGTHLREGGCVREIMLIVLIKLVAAITVNGDRLTIPTCRS